MVLDLVCQLEDGVHHVLAYLRVVTPHLMNLKVANSCPISAMWWESELRQKYPDPAKGCEFERIRIHDTDSINIK